MNEKKIKSDNNVIGKDQAHWDVDTITDQILSDLKDEFPRSVIQETLKEIIPRYKNARIQTFVPIFIRRDVVEHLKTLQARYVSLS